MNPIKKIFHSPTKKKLLENFLSLSILQALNYLLPLITFPYLARVLGPEKFGLVSLAKALIYYLAVFTGYGFNLSATKEISVSREKKQSISKIFSSVITTKFLLGILSMFVLGATVLFIPKFRDNWPLYLLTSGLIWGQVLFPVWFFQGIEKMKYITILNVFSKTILTAFIFLFVRDPSDYLFVPLLNSLGSLLGGVLSLWIAFQTFKICFMLPTIKDIKDQLVQGWYLFTFVAFASVYTLGNTIILGLFTSNTTVGYYEGPYKLVKSLISLIGPVTQTVYPHIGKLANVSQQRALAFIKKLNLLISPATLVVSISIFFFARPIILIILGPQYLPSIATLRILSFLPFIVGLSNIFGVQTMINFNLEKVLSKIIISAGILNTCFALPLSLMYKHNGTALAILFTESYVATAIIYSLRRRGIQVLNITKQRQLKDKILTRIRKL